MSYIFEQFHRQLYLTKESYLSWGATQLSSVCPRFLDNVANVQSAHSLCLPSLGYTGINAAP